MGGRRIFLRCANGFRRRTVPHTDALVLKYGLPLTRSMLTWTFDAQVGAIIDSLESNRTKLTKLTKLLE